MPLTRRDNGHLTLYLGIHQQSDATDLDTGKPIFAQPTVTLSALSFPLSSFSLSESTHTLCPFFPLSSFSLRESLSLSENFFLLLSLTDTRRLIIASTPPASASLLLRIHSVTARYHYSVYAGNEALLVATTRCTPAYRASHSVRRPKPSIDGSRKIATLLFHIDRYHAVMRNSSRPFFDRRPLAGGHSPPGQVSANGYLTVSGT